MTRDEIIASIRALAEELGRVPGEAKFSSDTGITRSELWSVGFSKYSEAVAAAELKPNQFNAALDTAEMLAKLAGLTRELGKFPSKGDLKVARGSDKSLPSYEAYFRLGGNSYAAVPMLLYDYCLSDEAWGDVAVIVEQKLPKAESKRNIPAKSNRRVTGYVYLVKYGQDYKIGRSNDVARRRQEISLLLPKELEHVHIIETDDPAGIERYWHERFKDRRVRGEWFRLEREDVVAFKRRKYQ